MWIIIYCEGEHEKIWIEILIKQDKFFKENEIKRFPKIDLISLGKVDKTNCNKINKYIKGKTKEIKKRIWDRNVKKHGKPKEFVIIDADTFKENIKSKPDNFFFSQPCLENFLLNLFDQKPKSKTSGKTLKKQLNSFCKEKLGIENKVKNINRIYQKAQSKKLIAKALQKDYAICKLLRHIKKLVEANNEKI